MAAFGIQRLFEEDLFHRSSARTGPIESPLPRQPDGIWAVFSLEPGKIWPRWVIYWVTSSQDMAQMGDQLSHQFTIYGLDGWSIKSPVHRPGKWHLNRLLLGPEENRLLATYMGSGWRWIIHTTESKNWIVLAHLQGSCFSWGWKAFWVVKGFKKGDGHLRFCWDSDFEIRSLTQIF